MTSSVLFFSPSWLGDAVMAIPTLRQLRRARPDARIAVLARGQVANLYAALSPADGPDEVIPYHRPSGTARFARFLDLIRRLGSGFDTALILPRSFGAAWTALLAGIPRRIGYAASGRDFLLTDAVPRVHSLLEMHRVRYFLHLLTALDVAPGEEPPSIAVPDADRARASELLAPVAAGGPLVVLNPGANYGGAKQWPEERYVELGRRLARDHGCALALVGGPGDHPVCDRIRHEIDAASVLDLSGRTTVLELAAVLERARLVVSNDTGAMHVAAAVGAPIVAIFGSTDPITTSPSGDGHTIVREPVECSPCLLRECPIDHRCMTRIPVERVLAACLPHLAGARVTAER